ncbi:piggyBac transposable element-derived protein 4-like [Palaemon carinicauda]|uniref:piggyBac transposable element-derived protein 4-like n=1 Tax=Palaemon carinicauda TaxID=392227 RepID=UPI0035B5DFC6
MAKHQHFLGYDQINSLLFEPESDVDDNLEVADISDDEELYVAELEESVLEEDESAVDTKVEDDDDDEGPIASVFTTTTLPSALNSHALPPQEERSTKRRGELQPARGAPINRIEEDMVQGRDGTLWHKEPNPALPPMFTPRIEPGGPTSSVSSARRVVDIFSLFLDDEILQEIVVHSNVRLALLRSRYHHNGNADLRDIDVRELKGFIGILVMSAIRNDNHTTTKDMWDPMEGNPLYRCTMSEHRFALLMRVLRFDDSTTRAERWKDRLAPIRKVWDHVMANCRRLYSPGPHLTVDKQLVAFRGRCPFKMYIPNKPAKYGIKLVLTCDVDTHYMCNAIPYLGKDTVEVPRGLTLGEVFTMNPVAPFHRRGRTVTTDNFFTSIPLALALEREGVYLCGTLRQKPYVPKQISEKVLPIKDSVAVFNYEHNLTLQCQQVNRTKKVMLLNSLHHNPSEVEKRKTDIQMFYNLTKRAVDIFDQMWATSNCIRKTRRWPLCLFYGILNIVMVNSYILYTSMPFSKSMPRRTFLKDIVFDLCAPQV